MIIKELKNGKGEAVAFAFDPPYPLAVDFVHYDKESIFSFRPQEDVTKMFLINIDNFDDLDRSTQPTGWPPEDIGEHKAWNLETTLETYQELVDMGINNNVLLKALTTRSKAWEYWEYYFDLTDTSDEDIAMVLMRWKGIIYDRKD